MHPCLLRCRPWLPAVNQAERDSRAALVDPRPEPGVLDILAHWVVTNERQAIALAIFLDLAACTGLALMIGSNLK